MAIDGAFDMIESLMASGTVIGKSERLGARRVVTAGN
jgi:hypothetical protein